MMNYSIPQKIQVSKVLILKQRQIHIFKKVIMKQNIVNFFLCHGDAETWMDAKGSQGAWSPRGNRGVEIQALWYTALQIGSKLAALNGDKLLAEHWLVIAQTLKKNFTNYFWNDFSYRMYDHLNPDGSVDKKIRPNQIFTVTVPDLAGIEHVGIGLDLCDHVKDYHHIPKPFVTRDLIESHDQMADITAGLIERGYSDEDIIAILGGNFRRVFGQVLLKP